MILIGDELITALKTVSFSATKVKVTDAYSVSTPTFPMITLDELPSNDGVYLDNQPEIVRNIFTVEAYAHNMTVRGNPMSKRAVAMLMISEADKFLNETYGLTMSGNVIAVPYSDTSVFRAAANYFAYIDTRTNLIYRGIN